MAKYLLIESRDPYDSADSPNFLELVRGVRERNNNVTLFLIQNGVLAARDRRKSTAWWSGSSSAAPKRSGTETEANYGQDSDHCNHGPAL